MPQFWPMKKMNRKLTHGHLGTHFLSDKRGAQKDELSIPNTFALLAFKVMVVKTVMLGAMVAIS